MGEHKYSVLDIDERPNNSNSNTSSSEEPPLIVDAQIEIMPLSEDTTFTTPVVEEIPNLPVNSAGEAVVSQVNSTKVAAGVASGVVGMLLGGPMFGVALAFGAAYAHDRPGAVGDVSRAVGDLAISARSHAQEIDNKHHVVETTKAAASQALDKAQQYDRENRVVEKVQRVLTNGWKWTVDFVHRHNLIERGVQNVGKGVVWVAEKIANKINSLADQQPVHAEATAERVTSKDLD
jgi:hypothetical protein